jgi:RNA polymerase sigma-70 factor, ECF subfamily
MKPAVDSPTMTPNELLLATAAGDRRAFAELYAQTGGQLLGLAQRMLRNRAAAEEVIQDGFVRIWTRARDFDPARGSALAWMVTIMRNLALDRLRKERPSVPIDSVPDREHWADPGADPLAAAMISAEARALRACLDQLEEGPRRAITLAYWNGMSHEELAAHIDAPLGTVKSWIRRGLARLKGCLEP